MEDPSKAKIHGMGQDSLFTFEHFYNGLLLSNLSNEAPTPRSHGLVRWAMENQKMERVPSRIEFALKGNHTCSDGVF
jgi:hypothetical protein